MNQRRSISRSRNSGLRISGLASRNSSQLDGEAAELRPPRRSLQLSRNMSMYQAADNADRMTSVHSDHSDDSEESGKANMYVMPDTTYNIEDINKLREELKFMFQTPCQKWKTKRRFPFKLSLQLLKVVVVTLQCVIFSGERRATEDFGGKNHVAFQNIFLKNWDRTHETPVYPPAGGPNAVYTTDAFYEHLNFAISRYFKLEDMTLSSVTHYEKPPFTLKLCRTVFTRLDVEPRSEFYNYDPEPIELCCSVTEALLRKPNCQDSEEDCYDIEEYFREQTNLGNANCAVIDFRRLLNLEARFRLKGVNIRRLGVDKLLQPVDDADCITFNVKIIYNNEPRTGAVITTVETDTDYKTCSSINKKSTIEQSNLDTKAGITVYDCIVIVVCLISTSLVIKSLYRAITKMKQTKKTFTSYFGYNLTMPEHMHFLSLWYFEIIVSDALAIVGSCLKIYIRWGPQSENVTFDSSQLYVATSILLGLANIFEWFGIVRYLGYFSRYYVLILTMTNAAPAIVRFLVCVATIWMGFLISGWIILGAFTIKFDSFSITMDCLFSLIHGDEIYPTLAMITHDQNQAIWIISKFYIYGFITLYIVVIMNLMVAVLSDSYETVRDWYQNGMPSSFLERYISGEITIITGPSPNGYPMGDYFQHLDEQEVDDSYGLLAPFVCCLDSCVHHNINNHPRKHDSDEEGNEDGNQGHGEEPPMREPQIQDTTGIELQPRFLSDISSSLSGGTSSSRSSLESQLSDQNEDQQPPEQANQTSPSQNGNLANAPNINVSKTGNE